MDCFAIAIKMKTKKPKSLYRRGGPDRAGPDRADSAQPGPARQLDRPGLVACVTAVTSRLVTVTSGRPGGAPSDCKFASVQRLVK
jgi:hypothetical protein